MKAIVEVYVVSCLTQHMPNQPPPFPPVENRQPSYSNHLPEVLWRDLNINNGPGSFTIHNDNRIIHQSRQIRWHIQGTDEEEMEYGQASNGIMAIAVQNTHLG